MSSKCLLLTIRGEQSSYLNIDVVYCLVLPIFAVWLVRSVVTPHFLACVAAMYLLACAQHDAHDAPWPNDKKVLKRN